MIEEVLQRIFLQAGRVERLMVGIAGPPGAGKSTFAERLRERIIAGGESVGIVPMDGFHLGNDELERLGLLDRKGAPETFDAAGFVDLVGALRGGRADIAVPGFDRALDATVPEALSVDRQTRVVLVEGNYLLLADEPWSALRSLFDLTILLAPTLSTLEDRLVQRWLAHGLTPDAARRRALLNDIPNARTVLSGSVNADIVVGPNS